MGITHFRKMLVLLAVVTSGNAWGATSECRDWNTFPRIVNASPTISSRGPISSGADDPVGTVLLTINATPGATQWPGILCSGASDGVTYNINQYLRLFGSATPVADWTGQYEGALFESGVPGIGYAIVNRDGYANGQAVPYGTDLLKWTAPITGAGLGFTYGNRLDIVFIKTGPITPGVIDASDIPHVLVMTDSSISTTNLTRMVWNVSFTGSIPVSVGTCNVASSPNVSMGTHMIQSYFGIGKPNSTPWIPFNIILRNCSNFDGRYATGSVSFATGATPTFTNFQRNYLQTTFTPVNGVIDNARSIMRLQPVSGAATGVGLQLAYNTGAAEPVPFNFSTGFRQNVTTNTSTPGTQVIPMQARYIQTGTEPVTPGIANSSTVFTVNYR